jgi:ComF family protein
MGTLLDWLFPPRCAVCRRAGLYCCLKCLADLPPAPPLPAGEGVAINALFNYRHSAVRQLVWQLKFRGVREIAGLFAGALYDHLIGELAELEGLYPGDGAAWLLVPIPSARARLRSRGFNQAAEIARRLTRYNPRDLELAADLLTKTRLAPPQSSLARREDRERNARDLFRVADPPAAHGRRVILIDDITTTGATFRDAARALRSAGARRVIALAVAHG